MRQAYAHIEPGMEYYSEIEGHIKKLVDNWNTTHNSKADFRTIADDFKRIFKYHKWISIDDIEPAIDLGLMGEFGENKGLNSETIYKWFTGLQKHKNQNELKQHTAYKTESTFISMDKRKKTRDALIETFMKFFWNYQKTKVYDPKMDHYLPVFWRWFKKLGLIQVSEDEENEMQKYEAERLRDLRTLFSKKKEVEIKTTKAIFIDAFTFAANENFDIETQLKTLRL